MLHISCKSRGTVGGLPALTCVRMKTQTKVGNQKSDAGSLKVKKLLICATCSVSSSLGVGVGRAYTLGSTGLLIFGMCLSWSPHPLPFRIASLISLNKNLPSRGTI